MSLEDPISTNLISGIALRQYPLAILAVADPFLIQANCLQFFKCQPAGSSIAKPTSFEKKTASELMKVNPRTQCYRCQGYGHLASQCPSQTKTLLVEVLIEDVEKDGLKVMCTNRMTRMPLLKNVSSMVALEL